MALRKLRTIAEKSVFLEGVPRRCCVGMGSQRESMRPFRDAIEALVSAVQADPASATYQEVGDLLSIASMLITDRDTVEDALAKRLKRSSRKRG